MQLNGSYEDQIEMIGRKRNYKKYSREEGMRLYERGREHWSFRAIREQIESTQRLIYVIIDACGLTNQNTTNA